MKIGKLLAATALVCSSAAVLMAPVGTAQAYQYQCAQPELEAAGSFTVETQGPNFLFQISEDLCFINLPATFIFEGDLEGSFSSDFHIAHFGACDQPAFEIFWTKGTYEGSVLGGEGTFDYNFQGTIVDNFADGTLFVKPGSGTDELEDLSGYFSLSGISGVSGDYEGSVDL